ncbi:MAG: dipicolinate synthase subunit DpsA [Clostridiales bacterium]|jgi:dipicolinate synthase subunit A|nr:dipicolinate synthase subunit DpsA [Clostridiales bacterium]
MKTFLIYGGDMRQIMLAKLLKADGHNVIICGFDMQNVLSNSGFENTSNVDLAIKASDYIILPLPSTISDDIVNTKFNATELSFSAILGSLGKAQEIYAGMVTPTMYNLCKAKDVYIYDYFTREELQVANAIPTAEGALAVAIKETPTTINGSKSIVLGYGRIGKILSKMLYSLGGDVTVCARKPEDFSWIKANGYTPLHIDDLNKEICNYSLIFNTVPAKILNHKMLKQVSRKSLVVDLASKPGGVDFEAAAQLGINVHWALSLPGKVAPETSALIIKDTISNMIKETEVKKR